MLHSTVTVIRGGETAFINNASGVVVDSITLGGVIKHYVRLDDGTTVVAQELTRGDRAPLAKGARTGLGWRAEDTLVLPLERAITRDAGDA